MEGMRMLLRRWRLAGAAFVLAGMAAACGGPGREGAPSAGASLADSLSKESFPGNASHADSLSAGSSMDSLSADSSAESNGEPAVGGDLYVFAAASLKNAMEEAIDWYCREHPDVEVLLNTDSSGTLKTQIEEGVRCDVFVSAATRQMDELVADGFVDEADTRPLLENRVVLIKGAGADTRVTGFSDIPNAADLALAGEDVPVGQYAREIFESLGILDEVMAMDINEGANVTAVLAAVAERSNEVGVVYATDALSMEGQVEVIANAPQGSLKTPVLYPVGLVGKEQRSAARDFYGFLQSAEALEIFERYGFSAAP